jgi:hypothetical protein
MSLVDRLAGHPDQFLFKTIPLVDPLVTSAPLADLVAQPWETTSGTANISVTEV